METLEEKVRDHILEVLDLCSYSRTDAAIILDISPRTLRNHIINYKNQGHHIPKRMKDSDIDLIDEVISPVLRVSHIVRDTIDEYVYQGCPTNDQRLYYLDTGNMYEYATNLSSQDSKDHKSGH